MNKSISIEESEEFRLALLHSAKLLGQNQPQEAEKILLQLYNRAPLQLDVLINLGGAYILQRKWNKAVRVLKNATRAYPENAMLWMNLGAAQLGRLELSGPKQQADAIASFQRALDIDPKTANAHYQIALIYKDQGNFERALTYFEAAIAVQPSDRDAAFWIEKLKAQNRFQGV